MATAPKLPPKDARDEELGRAKILDPTKVSRSSTPESVALEVPEEKMKPADYFMETVRRGQNLFGTKIAGKKKTRKQKKRVHKKTQKRRGKK